MPLATDTVIDQYGRPVASAQVFIRNDIGQLVTPLDGSGNPKTTDANGRWSCRLNAGVYTLTITKGSATLTRELSVYDVSNPNLNMVAVNELVTSYNSDRLIVSERISPAYSSHLETTILV